MILRRVFLIAFLVFIHGGVSSVYSEVILTNAGAQIRGKVKSIDASTLILQTRTKEISIPTRGINKVLSDTGRVLDRQQLIRIIESNKYQAQSLKSKQARLQKKREKKNKKKGSTPVVEFYMTNWCPYCRKMEQFLRQNNIAFEKFNIDNDTKANRRFKRYGGSGVPLLKIGQKIIKGYDPQGVKAALR